MAPIQHDFDDATPRQLAEAHKLLSDYRTRSADRVRLYFVLMILGALLVGVSTAEVLHALNAGTSTAGALSLLVTGGAALASGVALLVRNAVRIRHLEQMISALTARLLR